MARISCIILAFVLLLVAFSASFPRLQAARDDPQGVQGGEEEVQQQVMPQGLCGYKSKTFSGQCIQKTSCAYQCQVVEHAAAGACHFHHVQRHCYCYRYC